MLKLSTGEKFIPKDNGNDKEDKPITFNLKYLTCADRAEMNVFYVPVKATGKSVSVKFDARDAFLRGVKSIENCEVEIDGKIETVTTPERFAELPGLEGMYLEVCMRIKETSGLEIKN